MAGMELQSSLTNVTQLDSLEKLVAELRYLCVTVLHKFVSITFLHHCKNSTNPEFEDFERESEKTCFNQEFFGMTGAVDIINSTLGKVGYHSLWIIIQCNYAQ